MEGDKGEGSGRGRATKFKGKGQGQQDEEGTSQSQSQSPVEQVKDPMQIEVVLDVLFSYVPSMELGTSRLVCRKWRDIATKKMAKRRNIHVNLGCEDVEQFKDVFEGVEDGKKIIIPPPYSCLKWTCVTLSENGFPDVVEIFKDSLKELTFAQKHIVSSCYCKIQRKRLHIPPNRRNIAVHLFTALQEVANKLEVLDLNVLHPLLASPPGELGPQLQEFTFTMAALQKIVFPTIWSAVPCPTFWSYLFRVSPNLVDVRLNNAITCRPVLIGLQLALKFQSLKKLRLDELEGDGLDAILRSTMQLEELKVNIFSKTVSSEKIEKLLTKSKSSLEVLFLGSVEEDRQVRIKLPKMPELKELELSPCGNSLIVLEGLKFHEDLPKLESLIISSPYPKLNWKEFISYDPDALALKSVKRLSIGWTVRETQCWQYMAKIFPSVESLSFDFPKSIFLKSAWKNWSTLKELYIYFTDDHAKGIDRALFEFPVGWYAKAKAVMSEKMYKFPHSFVKSGILPPTTDGMGQLKGLQRLTIEIAPDDEGSDVEDDYDEDSKYMKKDSTSNLLSDVAVYYGLRQLKELRVCKIGKTDFSSRAVRYLRNQLPMIKSFDVRRSDGPGAFSAEKKRK